MQKENNAFSYIRSNINYYEATTHDNHTIASILNSTSMVSWVSLTTLYEPDYFQSAYLFGRKHTIIARKEDTESAVGMCSYNNMDVFVNGKAQKGGYLAELRVLPEHRNRINVLKNGFKSIYQLSRLKPSVDCWFTSIAKENKNACRLLEANLRGMPVYRRQGEMITLPMPVSKGKLDERFVIASSEDIPDIVSFYNNFAKDFQYSPVLTEQWLAQLDGKLGLRIEDFYLLKEHDELKACFCVWDQRKVKQTVIKGYRFPLNILRTLYNIYARLSGAARLPAVGKQVNYVFISFLAVKNKNDYLDVVNMALHLAKQKDAETGVLGIAKNSPFMNTLSSYTQHAYHTYIESVRWDKNDSPDTCQLDRSKPVQPEIALL